jgi:hypothetical protein
LKVEGQEKDLHRGRGGRRVHREAKRRKGKRKTVRALGRQYVPGGESNRKIGEWWKEKMRAEVSVFD